MKLESFAVGRFGILRHQHDSNFCSGINCVYGESGNGKSTLRHLIRAILYGVADDTIQSFLEDSWVGEIGSLQVQDSEQLVSLLRSLDEPDNGSLEIVCESEGQPSSRNVSERIHSLLQVVDQATYTSVFNLSFEQKRSLLGRVVATLRSKLSVPTGESGQLDRAAYDQWRAEQNEFEAKLNQLVPDLTSKHLRRGKMQSAMDSAEAVYHAVLRKLENEILGASQNLACLQSEYESILSRHQVVKDEIAQPKIPSGHRKSDSELVSVDASANSQLIILLYQRLDVIDENLRRWQIVQAEIQNERLRIREAIASWMEIDIDSSLHPYHESQKIVSRLEQILASAEARVESQTSMAGAVSDSLSVDSCREMRSQLFQLCRELESQYKQVRKQAAVAELKQLRRCYTQITASIHQLAIRRERIVADIQSLDPAEANAIEPGHSVESDRVARLEQELAALESDLKSHGTEIQRVQLLQQDAIARRNELLAPDLDQMQDDQVQLDDEILRLSNEVGFLLQKLQTTPPQIETILNPVVDDASSLVSRLSDANISRLWIDAPSSDVWIRQSDGNCQRFSALARSHQSLVCLSLILAAAREFQNRGYALPVCLDELFENVDSGQHDSIYRVLDSVAQEGLQIILFTQKPIELNRTWSIPFQQFEIAANSRQSMPPQHQAAMNGPQVPAAKTILRPESNLQNGQKSEALPKSTQIVSIDQSTLLRNTSLIDEDHLTELQDGGVHAVADLLDVDPDLMDTELTRRGISSDLINQWQSQIWLKISIPELSSTDSLLLFLCGVTDPIQLDSVEDSELKQRMAETCAQKENGGRFVVDRYDDERLAGWRDSFSRNRSMWRNHQRYLRRTRQQRRWSELERESIALTANDVSIQDEHSDQHQDPEVSVIHLDREQPDNRPVLKFYLSLADDVEAAPSIGIRTAERFANIGIVTIQDLLDASSIQMADEIDYKRIKAKDIENWQHQARLVCQIPNLRGHDAQLLVACSIIDPLQLAKMDSKELFDIIGPFSETKAGQKILRQSNKPDQAEVSNWIQWANESRPLQAAA